MTALTERKIRQIVDEAISENPMLNKRFDNIENEQHRQGVSIETLNKKVENIEGELHRHGTSIETLNKKV